MDTLKKYWKVFVGVALALLGVFLFKAKRESDTAKAKVDTKDTVDEAVKAVKPKTEEAIASIQNINKVEPVKHETGEGKDIQDLVDTYNKE